ncbi:hypothetical protein KFL_008410030 [Klebsormidium nitens]|uniref:Uncharacterized protein n=1 Tax=Klebsormidium nitens TaxID=105231 RepID=A0A1Y1INR6_KLENI|nr:hypothetical protein KFL_008410030 [Klebsormidium nitens]|eukprot:GAQ91732.1 hypothetical protein KFL_008410030 [Klebsormidium nitens]
MKKGSNRKSIAKLGPTGRPRPGAGVLRGLPAVPPGRSSKGKGSAPERSGIKKASARETPTKKTSAGCRSSFWYMGCKD